MYYSVVEILAGRRCRKACALVVAVAQLLQALVLVQQPEARVAPIRKRIDKFIGEKHEEVMCKMGAIMAAGILDAGGRNATIGLRSRSGYMRRTSVVGLAIFTQYW